MDGPTKAFLRGTVLVLDMSVYSTAVWWLVKEHKQRLQPGVTASDATSLVRRDGCLVGFVIATLQPALILVDHGHFQYNTVALGLALWSFYFMTRPQFSNCVWGSILFVLALSFKQMTLYYAPAVFSYLLGRCAAPSQPRNNVPNHPPPPVSSVLFWKRFVALGLTVMGTFGVLWGPIVWYGPTGTTPVSRLLHVLRRVLPLERGLFESKVSNVWCVLSLRPVKIRERIPVRLQPVAAFALTTALMLPSCVALFRGARRKSSGDPTSMSERFFVSQHRDLLLRGTACCACAFFLASFQVHEKSLLLALAPASLLAPPLGDWFGIVATWTLWPLLVLDRLQTAYWCTLVFFAVALSLRKTPIPNSQVQRLIWLSYAAMAVLHGLELAVPPPSRMPDLFPVLWSVLGCALVSSAWLVLSLQLLSADHPLAVSTTLKTIKLA
jgi:alpha-1,3-glucosyltransferase